MEIRAQTLGRRSEIPLLRLMAAANFRAGCLCCGRRRGSRRLAERPAAGPHRILRHSPCNVAQRTATTDPYRSSLRWSSTANSWPQAAVQWNS